MQRDLVERAMRGDHDAFSDLTRQTARGMLVLASLILRDSVLAEDATQEAYVAAWRHIRGLRDPDRFDAWIRRLLVNACHHEARRAGRQRTTEIRMSAPDVAFPDQSAQLLDRDELDRGFARLDIDQRAVVVLTQYVGLSLAETAEVLGVPPGTVRSRLFRGLQAMRATLEADAREGTPA